MKSYIQYLLIFIFLISCDISFDDPQDKEKIVGNLYVKKSHFAGESGYTPVIVENSGEGKYILTPNVQIDYLRANDTFMILKTKNNGNVEYFSISHYFGDSISAVKPLSKDQFELEENTFHTLYYFKDTLTKR